MSLRTMFRRAKRQGITAPAQVQANEAGAVRQLEVSQDTLNDLIQGYNTLSQRRQQLVQQIQELDIAIRRQEGGIQIMQNLLAGQVDKGE